MVYKIKILPLAFLDIKEIAEWYEDVQKGLGKRFLKSIKQEVKIIKYKPELYQIRYDNTRVTLINIFPYLIHFEIVEKLIIIKSVIHTSRDSNIWEINKNF